MLAAAMPPDQIWIAGIYDAADLDDLVMLVTDLCGNQRHSPELFPASFGVGFDQSQHECYETPDSRPMARGSPHDRSAHVIFGAAAPDAPSHASTSALPQALNCPARELAEHACPVLVGTRRTGYGYTTNAKITHSRSSGLLKT
jgi:hypothetical protein